MAIAVMNWVLEEAPDLPGHCFAVLMALASKANEDGRGAYPGQKWLAERARKTVRQVRSDLTKLEEIGLIRRGNQALVEHFAGDERPIVWDIAIDRKHSTARKPTSGPSGSDGSDQREGERERKPTSARQSTSGRKSASGGERKHTSANTSRDKSTSPPTGESDARAHEQAREANTPPNGDGRIPLPDDFVITDAMRRWATRDGYAPLVDIDYETAQLISHARAEAWRRASWPDEWQKWIRRAHKRAVEQKQRQNSRDPTSPPGTAGQQRVRPREEWMHRR